MPKRDPRKGWTPKPYPVRPGLIRVRVGGKSRYFSGPDALAQAHAWIAEWVREQAAGGPAPAAPSRPRRPTVADLIAAYKPFAEAEYRKNGRPTSEIFCVRSALRVVRRLYGDRVIDGGFGPDELRAVLEEFARQPVAWKCPRCGKTSRVPRDCWTCRGPMAPHGGWSRKHCNDQLHRTRRCFRWGLSRGYTPPGLMERLAAVEPLKEGRTRARESEEVPDVPEGVVEATLPELAPVVRAMVLLQRAAGMRPTEVCVMRPKDVDRSGDVWLYRPWVYKTQHWNVGGRKRRRKVWLGPRAQEVLRPFLAEAQDPEAFLFRNRCGRPFNHNSYRLAVVKGAARAGVPHWSPMQLRKTLATAAEARWNLEHARAALGHRREDVTAQRYSKAEDQMARKVAEEFG